jgi:AraC-like DNA-binding protein
MLSIAQYFELLTALLGSEWHPSAVYFIHKSPEDDQAYRHLFKSPVYFEQTFNGMIFPEHFLQTPIPSHDPSLLKSIEQHINMLERKKYADNLCIDTRSFIHRTLGTSTCNLHSAATYLGVHPKTLQRELKANNLTFKLMLAETRQEISEYYLENSDMSLIQLSALLGYSCPAAFSRAFKKNYNISPQQYRTQRHPLSINL